MQATAGPFREIEIGTKRKERERERGVGKGGREKEERSACSSLRYIGATI